MEYSYDRSRHFEIPKYFYFEVENGTVGSMNTFNYQILPKEVGEGDEKKKVLYSKVWYGENCAEKSEAAAERDFEHSEDGYKQMIYWVDEQFDIYCAKLHNGEVKSRRTFNGDI